MDENIEFFFLVIMKLKRKYKKPEKGKKKKRDGKWNINLNSFLKGYPESRCDFCDIYIVLK